MAARENFDIGDLVWAKMKGFPFWPAKIVDPPINAKSTPKKARHYVFFFGSANYAWIQDENIVHHSEEMLKSTSNKKKSTTLKLAIEQIINEGPKQVKLLVKEKEYPEESLEVSTSGTEKKIAKARRNKRKTGGHKVEKKAVPKRRTMDESQSERTSPPRKLSKRSSEDLSELVNNTPPNLNYEHTAISRPLDENPPDPTPSSSGITRNDYLKLLSVPPFDLHKPNEAIITKNVQPSHEKIGFIGLGMMGQRLVKNLLTSNHKVTVWNRTYKKCEYFVEVGAEVAQTPSDVVEKCNIIFCCVSDSEASKSLVFGKCGILSGIANSPPGSKSYVELTTLDPSTSIDIAEAITSNGGKYLEAPFNGSRKSADDGSLLILSAGDMDVFASCESFFFTLSKNTYYLGPDVGMGSKTNLILSMLMGVSYAGLAETLSLVERSELEPTNFLDIIELGPIGSPSLIEKGRAMMSRFFETNIPLKNLQRDMSLALRLNDGHRRPMLVTSAANEVFKRAKLRNYSDHDVSAVYMGAEY